MEYVAGSSRKDPGQGHINLLSSDNMITEAPMKQFEPCHCCKTYDRPCLRSSPSKKRKVITVKYPKDMLTPDRK